MTISRLGLPRVENLRTKSSPRMLLQLPSELQVRVLLHLSAEDVAAVSKTNQHFHRLCWEESIWIHLARLDFGARLKVTAEFSPRLYYQSILYPFRNALGLWQRRNLKYYGGLLKVSVRDQRLMFEDVIPPYRIDNSLEKVAFLRLTRMRMDQEVVIENLSSIALSDGARIVKPSPDEPDLKVILSNIEDHTLNPSEWRQVMLDFVRQVYGGEGDIDVTDLLLMRFVQTYHSRALYSYRRLELTWPESGPILKPGLFVGTYGPHGTEIIELTVTDSLIGTCGTKVTGDPNVPFGEISFRLCSDQCLNIPRENQETMDALVEFLENPQYIEFQAGLELDFTVPANCFIREPILYTTSRGRWSCQCQVAGHGFVNPSLIPGNFILFSEDVFAVLFLELSSISLYRRVRAEEL